MWDQQKKNFGMSEQSMPLTKCSFGMLFSIYTNTTRKYEVYGSAFHDFLKLRGTRPRRNKYSMQMFYKFFKLLFQKYTESEISELK